MRHNPLVRIACPFARPSVLSAVLLSVCLAASGCGNGNQDARDKPYTEGGYMEMSSANSGIPTNPYARNIRNDTKVVDRALSGLPHIRRKLVQFRGGTAVIRLKLEDGISDDERRSLLAEAESRLAAELPRYDVVVKEWRWP